MPRTYIHDLIHKDLERYGLVFQSLKIHSDTLTTYGKHGDLHYKILVDERPYSIRLLPKKRYANSDLSQSTSDILAQQLRYTDYLRAHGIPFMERLKPTHEALFTTINDSDGHVSASIA